MVSISPPFPILATRIQSAVRNIRPNLLGQRILCEAASGPFVATAVVAALAGAEQVIACTRDSRWGTASEITNLTMRVAEHFGVADHIEISDRPPAELAEGVDVVTNLGFVRPISREIIRKLSPNAAIALMWEPWEFRAQDIDIDACLEFGIPVVATNEQHPNVATFKAVGMLALKLLLERNCEVSGLHVLVVGSDPFGQACYEVLMGVGARVELLDPQDGWALDSIKIAFDRADALVVVEHRHQCELLGRSTEYLVELLARRHTPLVHICGKVDSDYLQASGVEKYPARSVPFGFMTVTTGYLGVKPVVDLHTAGLHVASIVARQRKRGACIDAAIELAVASGYGLRFCYPNLSTPDSI